ncbi:hypothetical protein HDU92_004695 [Lobulomyces angularis]|nr:hypothetical protein HDU92_004695 [Lobulomyces angularis]
MDVLLNQLNEFKEISEILNEQQHFLVERYVCRNCKVKTSLPKTIQNNIHSQFFVFENVNNLFKKFLIKLNSLNSTKKLGSDFELKKFYEEFLAEFLPNPILKKSCSFPFNMDLFSFLSQKLDDDKCGFTFNEIDIPTVVQFPLPVANEEHQFKLRNKGNVNNNDDPLTSIEKIMDPITVKSHSALENSIAKSLEPTSSLEQKPFSSFETSSNAGSSPPEVTFDEPGAHHSLPQNGIPKLEADVIKPALNSNPVKKSVSGVDLISFEDVISSVDVDSTKTVGADKKRKAVGKDSLSHIQEQEVMERNLGTLQQPLNCQVNCQVNATKKLKEMKSTYDSGLDFNLLGANAIAGTTSSEKKVYKAEQNILEKSSSSSIKSDDKISNIKHCEKSNDFKATSKQEPQKGCNKEVENNPIESEVKNGIVRSVKELEKKKAFNPFAALDSVYLSSSTTQPRNSKTLATLSSNWSSSNSIEYLYAGCNPTSTTSATAITKNATVWNSSDASETLVHSRSVQHVTKTLPPTFYDPPTAVFEKSMFPSTRITHPRRRRADAEANNFYKMSYEGIYDHSPTDEKAMNNGIFGSVKGLFGY